MRWFFLNDLNDNKKIEKTKNRHIYIDWSEIALIGTLIFIFFILLIFLLCAFFPNKTVISNFDTKIIDKYVYSVKNGKTINANFILVFYDEYSDKNNVIDVSEDDFVNYDIGNTISIDVVEYQNKILKFDKEIKYEIKEKRE